MTAAAKGMQPEMLGRKRNLTYQIRVALFVLGALAVLLFLGFAMVAASDMDGKAMLKEASFVREGLQDFIREVPHEQQTITVWDDHVTFSRANDQQWLAENVGEWMYEYFGHRRAFVFNDKDQPIYAMRDGKTAGPELLAEEAAVAELAAQLRQRLLTPRVEEAEDLSQIAETRVLSIGGLPAILSIRPIVPYANRVSVPAGMEYRYASVKFLDDLAVATIGQHYLLDGLHFVPESGVPLPKAAVPVTGSDGQILGHLVWESARPGSTFLQWIAPAGLAAMLVAIGIALFLDRRLSRASQELEEKERQSRHQATHDALTGLANRPRFEELLEDILGRIREGDGKAAILFLDLDRFKHVNDTLGHPAGDRLVCEVADRLGTLVIRHGAVARIGGDEFGIVLPFKDGHELVLEIAERIISALNAPFEIGGEVVHIGVSVGIALAPEAGCEQEELLRKADIALYEAKKQGGDCYRVFSEAMSDILRQRRLVEADLRKTLANGGNEFRLAYQPLYDRDGNMTGAEALLRWEHPVHHISPLFLITIAEEAGLIMQLGDWILRTACRMAATSELPWISVNVSAVQLRDPHFAERCLAIVREAGIEPHRIQIEVTENVLIAKPEIALATFKALRAHGMSVAIDDFGTGYASMSYLQQFPVDCLKIDRRFVQALSGSENGHAIVNAMIDMALALELKVVAEGVETGDQWEMLTSLGCHEMQGYLLARPMTGDQLLDIVKGTRAERA